MIELPKQERGFICTKCGSHECKPGTLNDKHPPCAKCDYLGFAQDTGYTADQLRTYGDQRAAEAREQMRGELKTVKKHALNGVDLPCIECGIVGCNGECSGDGAMGD